jgi:hypothetical protein
MFMLVWSEIPKIPKGTYFSAATLKKKKNISSLIYSLQKFNSQKLNFFSPMSRESDLVMKYNIRPATILCSVMTNTRISDQTPITGCLLYYIGIRGRPPEDWCPVSKKRNTTVSLVKSHYYTQVNNTSLIWKDFMLVFMHEQRFVWFSHPLV